jgi:hypothetical protein
MNIAGSSEAGSARRSFLKYVGGAGAAVVGAIAVTWSDAPRAAALSVKPDLYDVGCCTLATTNPCGGSWDNDGSFTCPDSAHKAYWACMLNSKVGYICWECQTGGGSDCYAATSYKCSNWYQYHV